MADGMTEKARRSQLLDSGLSTKAYKLGNPFIVKLKCYGVAVAIQLKSFDATLPRKVSKDII